MSDNKRVPTVVEYGDNITATIKGLRATAELMKVRSFSGTTTKSGFENDDFGELPEGNWLFFNRLINQSDEKGIGTLLLDAILKYCQEKGYSILNQVNAYGRFKQEVLEDWYIRKGFVPVDYKRFKNKVLMWLPKETNEKVNSMSQ